MSTYEIRSVRLEDAESLLEYLREIAVEPDNGIGLSRLEDIRWTVEEERDIIQRSLNNPTSLWLVLDVDGHIKGSLNCRTDSHPVMRYTAEFGISLHRDWRGKGIGTQMIQQMLDFCRANPAIYRLQLLVFTNNPRAIQLYERLGFVPEGIRRSVAFKQGEFLDSMMMAIVFTEKGIPTT